MDDKANDEQRMETIINQTDWSGGGQFNEARQMIGNVNIMVQNIPCIQENHSHPEKSCMQNASGLSVDHGSLSMGDHPSGDSLAALADAAELDQDRTDVSIAEQTKVGGLPLAPFLNPTDKEALFYNEIYHYIISKTLSSKTSESHKRIIRKRAANYMITEEGRLVYGNKNPKKVITDCKEQNYLMRRFHIVEETGSHVGVKKMQSYLSSNFHWRSMAGDINNFIKNCDQCCKFSPLTFDKSHPSESLDPLCPLDTATNIGQRKAPTPFVWKKVVLSIHGPYKTSGSESKFVVSVVDHFSKWVCAKVLTGDDLERNCAHFLYDCFCTFGFTNSEILDGSPVKLDRINWFLEEKLKVVVNTLNKSDDINFLLTTITSSEDYDWIAKLIDGFCDKETDGWDETLSSKLFKYNTSSSEVASSPFYMMFSRNNFSGVNEEEKENYFETPSVRRRLKSSTLQCRHCYETFTSKISFRIHQRRHTEDARRRGILDGEQRICVISEDKKSKIKKRTKFKSKGANRILTIANTEWFDGENRSMPSAMRSHLTQSTVEAVRNLLHATKEERNKRGKYFKYTPELRDHIAKYAMEHSISAASLYWSDRLRSTVSESSIRNFMKAYKCFSASIKEEIGRYAFHNGIERAAVDYTEKLGFEIRKGIVLKFKKLYTQKVCEGNATNQGGSSTKISAPCRQKRAFSFLMKEEIGRYAYLHGISAAIDYFSVKLQFSVKESTVRKFKRRYQERTKCETEETHPHVQGISTQEQGPSPNVEVLHAGIPPTSCHNPSAPACPVSTQNNFVYQHSYPINMTPGAGMTHNGPTAVLPLNHNIAFHQGGVINQGVAALSYQQSQGTPTVIMNQSFASVTPSSFQQSCINNFSQVGPSVAGCQSQPIAIAHTSLAPTAAHANGPLQLTMGGQLTPVPVPHPHLISHPPSMQHPQHHSQQIITSNFPNQITNGLSFDHGVQLSNHPSINFTNQPINLLKDGGNGMSVINHVCSVSNGNHMEDSAIGSSESTNGMPTTIVPLSGNTLTQMEQAESHPTQPSCSGHQRSMNLPGKCMDDEYLDEDLASLSDEEDEFIDSCSSPRKKHRTLKQGPLKFSFGGGRRGNYVSYTPELRAEIGRYATEHGNLEAISHFKDKVGLEIPESTVRGLKDKYLIKRIRGDKDVKSLGFGQRGRPMRLGRYDAVVQDCIRQLVKEGERISSFLVIATAKQVLTQHEPSLLEENGGPVTLNPTWAKSFLKRIGIHQVS